MRTLFGGSAVIAATILSSSFLLSAKPSVGETLLSSGQKSKQELSTVNAQDPKQDPAGLGLAENIATSKTDVAKPASESAKPANEGAKPALASPAAPAKAAEENILAAPAANPAVAAPKSVVGIVPADSKGATTYTATAYSLGGRTASGLRVTRGLIAADPRLLPLGTRVRLEAGSYSGEYLVADTGGAVRGKKIDIWTSNPREANRFGRRQVKLTVLSYPAKRAVTPKRKR
jgi:3D (Asp-Asp-Asp) domain-containing protein